VWLAEQGAVVVWRLGRLHEKSMGKKLYSHYRLINTGKQNETYNLLF